MDRSESMVSRVAKRIYEKRNGAGCKPWGRLPPAHRDPYLGDAMAAIEAMREPTEEMKRVFSSARPDSPKTVWHETIDAALA
jgi:hypothetical protein